MRDFFWMDSRPDRRATPPPGTPLGAGALLINVPPRRIPRPASGFLGMSLACSGVVPRRVGRLAPPTATPAAAIKLLAHGERAARDLASGVPGGGHGARCERSHRGKIKFARSPALCVHRGSAVRMTIV